MRLLFITHVFFPYWKGGGTYGRMMMFVEAFKSVDELDMLFFVPHDVDISPEKIAEYQAEMRKTWHPKINLFLCYQEKQPENSGKLSQKIKGIFNFQEQELFHIMSGEAQVKAIEGCLKRSPSSIFVYHLPGMLPLIKSQNRQNNQPDPPIYFDSDDLEHRKLITLLNSPSSSILAKLNYLQFYLLKWAELKMIKAAKITFVASQLDYKYLKSRNASNIQLIPNSVKLKSHHIPVTQPSILFVGSYAYLPNIQAAAYLVEKVFPKIRQHNPKATLRIVGGTPENIPTYHTHIEGVKYTGFVDDLSALYQQSRVVCSPIFSGSGTRLKLLEAAAYGKPIVSTTVGAEGLNLIHQVSFLEANNPSSLARACIQLLEDDLLCETIGNNAHHIIQSNYQHEDVVNRIKTHFNLPPVTKYTVIS